jgi:hypothetical protein
MQHCLRQGFVGGSALEVRKFREHFLMEGEIGCLGEIVIGVQKVIEIVGWVNNEPMVQTSMYAYNVSVRGMHTIFRYDTQHPDRLYAGHADPHHKHDFNWKTGDPLPESPIWTGALMWPTLGDVIWEARDWHAEHFSELIHPDAYASDLRNEMRF